MSAKKKKKRKKAGNGTFQPFKTKNFASYNDQIRSLNDKGHILDANSAYEETLREITYFRLKGYLQNKWNKTKGVMQLETACRLHEFDAQMRVLLFYVISKIELYLRSQFSYIFCDAYCKDSDRHVCKYSVYCACKVPAPDPYAYLKVENYSGKYEKMLDTFDNAIQEHKKTPFVAHYIKNYGGLMPLWVVTELLSFGKLVTFYQNWTPDACEALLRALYGNGDRYMSARHSNRFVSWLASCNYLRNVCAHCGRLYYRKFTQLPDFPYEFRLEKERKKWKKRKKRAVPKGKECKGDKTLLWGAVLALQFLYPNQDEWSDLIVKQIKGLLEKFAPEIGDSRLRAAIGFPDDWEYWLRYWRAMT